jgi:hypothetical protein
MPVLDMFRWRDENRDLAALRKTWHDQYDIRRDGARFTATRYGSPPLTAHTVKRLTARILADQALPR